MPVGGNTKHETPNSALAPFAKQHDVNRLQDDGRVEAEREVADVIEVVFQLAHRVLHAGAVRIIDLRPAGDAGLHEMSKMVAGNFLLISLDEAVPFGARADEAHVA